MLSPEEHERAALNEYNFDHPDAFDFELLISTLKRLKEGKHVNVPIYNFTTHRREKQEVCSKLLTYIFCEMTKSC